MATRMPYKGLSDTLQSREHTDVSNLAKPPLNKVHSPSTGSWTYNAADYAKLQKPANPEYYAPIGAGGADTGGGYPTAVHYTQRAVNNGQRTAANAYTTVETATDTRPGVTAHYQNGEEVSATWKASDTNTKSNYAMAHGAAAKYNGGVHVVQGLTNADYFAKNARTRFDVRGTGDY